MKTRWMVVGGFAALTLAAAGVAQTGGQQQGGNPQRPTSAQSAAQAPTTTGQSPEPVMDADEAVSVGTSHIAVEQERARNVERQKRLVEDTTKLVALVNELKTDVDKTNKDTLSVDVIKKADEIEKLARSVKDRMKGG